MRDLQSSGDVRLALLTLSLLSVLVLFSGCGEARVEVYRPNGPGLVQASGAHQAQGTTQNNALVGRSLASVSQENRTATISVRSGFGPLETYEKPK